MNNEPRAQNAVILTRVSFLAQDYSNEMQEQRLFQYAEGRNLKVLQVFNFVGQFTRGDNGQFDVLIKFIDAQKECVAIVVDKVDRIRFFFKYYPILDDLIRQDRIELHFNSENRIIHKSSSVQDR